MILGHAGGGCGADEGALLPGGEAGGGALSGVDVRQRLAAPLRPLDLHAAGEDLVLDAERAHQLHGASAHARGAGQRRELRTALHKQEVDAVAGERGCRGETARAGAHDQHGGVALRGHGIKACRSVLWDTYGLLAFAWCGYYEACATVHTEVDGSGRASDRRAAGCRRRAERPGAVRLDPVPDRARDRWRAVRAHPRRAGGEAQPGRRARGVLATAPLWRRLLRELRRHAGEPAQPQSQLDRACARDDDARGGGGTPPDRRDVVGGGVLARRDRPGQRPAYLRLNPAPPGAAPTDRERGGG